MKKWELKGTESLVEIETTLEEIKTACNEAINEGKPINELLTEFEPWEEAHAKMKTIATFNSLNKEVDGIIPMERAIREHTYKGKKHRVNQKEGVITEVEVNNVTRYINVAKFYKHITKKEAAWKLDISRLTQLLAVSSAKGIGAQNETLSSVEQTPYISRLLSSIKDGATPTSKTAIIKEIQNVANKILPPKVEGQNDIKIIGKDYEYIMQCFSGKGSTPLSVRISNETKVLQLVVDAMHRILTNSVYTQDSKAIANSAKKELEAAREAEEKEKAKKKAAKPSKK